MIEGENIEQILQQFRSWLEQARQDSASANSDLLAGAQEPPRVGLDRLVEEFTSLRHEIKLQTRSARSLEERLEASLTLLAEAAAALRSAAARENSTAPAAGKSFALALAELDEALERGREQWEKSSTQLIGAPSSPLAARLEEIYSRQSWWGRRKTASFLRQARQVLGEMEGHAREDRRRLYQALADGYALIQQRLARSMAAAGVLRIRATGQMVDPEQMIVVQVAEGEGPEGQVVEEIRRGYTWQGQLLRPAEVRALRPRLDSVNHQPS
jgi:molecular chaperone GrpE